MDYRPKKTIDIWLQDKGFYRKHVPIDETSLFRAVSDQIFDTQVFHERVRKYCIQYANDHREQFSDIVDDWDDYLDKLKNHFITCGIREMKILSRKFVRDIIVFDTTNYTISNITKHGYKKHIMLCKLKDSHYDSVYKQEQIENAGFCQSIVYKILYENVFDVDNIDETVQLMLHGDNENTDSGASQAVSNDFLDSFLPVSNESPSKSETMDNLLDSVDSDDSSKSAEFPPFPYKVAKALDPNQYRNVEFDAWNQTRKDIRIKDWYLGGEDFKVGTKCQVYIDSQLYTCYIQEMIMNDGENKCIVYIIDSAERRLVNRSELRAFPNAKPWPLPYCISRNAKKVRFPYTEYRTSLTNYNQSLSVNHGLTTPKTSKNRRNKHQPKQRSYSEGAESHNTSVVSESCEVQSAPALEGCPLISTANSHYMNMRMDSDSSVCEVFESSEVVADQTNTQMVPYDQYMCYQEPPFGPVSPAVPVQDYPPQEYPVHSFPAQNYPVQSYPIQNYPVQEHPPMLPQKSVAPNGTDLPFNDVNVLRYYFNLGLESARQNYYSMWLNNSGQPPFIGPQPYVPSPPNPQLYMSAQYNMVQQNCDSNNKFTMYTQIIKEYNLNNNNNAMPNFNEIPRMDVPPPPPPPPVYYPPPVMFPYAPPGMGAPPMSPPPYGMVPVYPGTLPPPVPYPLPPPYPVPHMGNPGLISNHSYINGEY